MGLEAQEGGSRGSRGVGVRMRVEVVLAVPRPQSPTCETQVSEAKSFVPGAYCCRDLAVGRKKMTSADI